MKIRFNIGIRMLLFKIKHLDSQYTPQGRTAEFYKQYIWEMVQQCNDNSDTILRAVGHDPVKQNYKKFKIKKL